MWIDISVAVAPALTPTWPDSPHVQFERRLSLARGDGVDDTTLRCSVHTGTHIDAPAHHLEGGATVDQLPIEVFVGPCFVADVRGHKRVTQDVLESAAIPSTTERLLLRTSNSELWGPRFDRGFVGLSLDGATWIARRSMRLVGIDYLSVQPLGETDDIHRVLMREPVAILEGLDLSLVDEGRYDLYCFPMKLVGTEGAPARAFLRK